MQTPSPLEKRFERGRSPEFIRAALNGGAVPHRSFSCADPEPLRNTRAQEANDMPEYQDPLAYHRENRPGKIEVVPTKPLPSSRLKFVALGGFGGLAFAYAWIVLPIWWRRRTSNAAL